MTYKEAESLIIDAYFKDEIKPYHAEFCFCGTLNKGNPSWFNSIEKKNGYSYSHEELKKLENCFLVTINIHTIKTGGKLDDCQNDYLNITNHPNFENALFEGMIAALEMLKQIHKTRGEDVDKIISFVKRDLKKKQASADGFNAPEPYALS